MSHRTLPRPGGRSARVQAAVHEAVKALKLELGDRAALTVPAIATRAGVTPSTIYRRWGDLPQLLAAVAVDELHPDAEPLETGSFDGDIVAWLEQYFDEISSAPGRAMLRDILGNQGYECTGKCNEFIRGQLEQIAQRTYTQQTTNISIDLIVDDIVGPLLYGLLFANRIPSKADILQRYAQIQARV